MSKTLIGGPCAGVEISNNEEDKSWIIRYTLNGNLWKPANGLFYKNFPKGVIRHGYRKQGTKGFHYVWSRNNDEE